jgi:hypothetical protein
VREWRESGGLFKSNFGFWCRSIEQRSNRDSEREERERERRLVEDSVEVVR